MEFRERRRPPVRVGLTPLIDLVFLLLIFFMLTASFKTPTALRIDLPKVDRGAEGARTGLSILIDGEGAIFLDEKEVKPEVLVGLLRKGLNASTEREVVIRGDRNAPFGIAVRVMETVREAGAEVIFVAAEMEKRTAP